MKTWRRSRYVGFSVLGAAAALAAGCNKAPNPPPPQSAQLYRSVDECARERPRADCERAWAQAQDAHARNAQAFASRPECEQQWGTGNCQSYNSRGTDWFIPALTGFMLARAMSPNGGYCRPGVFGCPSDPDYYGGHGVYFGRGGSMYSENERIGTGQASGSGFVMPRSVAVAPGSRFALGGSLGGAQGGATTLRGGFGRSSGLFGGGRG
jgi:uncharacterized protein YgiB involved in biofilm formation